MASPLTIQPDAAAGKDAQIYSGAATTNYGTNVACGSGDFGSGAAVLAHGLFAFDVSGIPAGAIVTSVTLSLWETTAASSGGAPASWAQELHRLLRDWVEAEATWNVYSTGNNWSTAGATNAADRAAAVSASLTMDGTAAGAFVDWSGAGLVADVQAWVDGMATNYGWLLYSPTLDAIGATPVAYNSFCTSDYTTDAAQRPKLVIEYHARALMTDHYSRMRRG